MLKIIGALMILTSATLLGFYRSDKLRRRCVFFKDFISFLSLFKARLRYECTDIKTLVGECGRFPSLEPLCGEFSAESDAPVKALWEKGIAKCCAASSLNDEDAALLREFGMPLGSTDMQGQLEHICLYETLAQKHLSDAERSFLKNGKLYKMLGFFAGTAAAITIL